MPVPSAWEALVLENVMAACRGWKMGFYRTSAGAEIDLVLEKKGRRIAVECKASATPQVSKGFWNCLQDMQIKQAWIIAPVKAAYPIANDVTVSPLLPFLQAIS